MGRLLLVQYLLIWPDEPSLEELLCMPWYPEKASTVGK